MIRDKFIAFLILIAGALACMWIASFMPFVSPLIIAVIMGALLSNFFLDVKEFVISSGVGAIASKQILRLGVMLYGFSISLFDIEKVGFSGVGFAFCIVFVVFFTGLYLGQKMGLSKSLSALIACGSAICGAAAVLALSSIIKANSQKVGIALATVVVYGTLAMFIDVILFSFTNIGLNQIQIGYLLGGSLHEVAHVVAAGAAISENTGHSAVIIKMLRVLMLVPFLFMASFMFKTKEARGGILSAIPYFALGFLAMIILGSMPFFPREILPFIRIVDTFLLCVAMFALGFNLSPSLFKQAGAKPFILAFMLSLLLFVVAYALSINL